MNHNTNFFTKPTIKWTGVKIEKAPEKPGRDIVPQREANANSVTDNSDREATGTSMEDLAAEPTLHDEPMATFACPWKIQHQPITITQFNFPNNMYIKHTSEEWVFEIFVNILSAWYDCHSHQGLF